MQKKRWFMLAGVLAAMVALAVLVAACSDDDDGDAEHSATEPAATEPAGTDPTATEPAATDSTATEPADEETLVDVTMTEFSVTSLVDTVPAGTVKFVVRNTGAIDHNLRVIKTDLAPDALPTDAGEADESQLDVIASTEDFGAGESRDVSADLEPGSYVLICNFVGHYQSGMTVAFTVE